MPNNIATSINIGDPIGLFGEHYDIGVEAQNVVISYDADGNVIEDIEQTPPVTTKSLATVLKNSAGNFYGSSSTAANIATKTVAVPVTQNFSLKPGTIVGIAFINTNTANNPTINVNNSGAKNIYKGTSIQTSGDAGIIGGTVSFFQYNGTYWIWMCSSDSSITGGVSDVLLDGTSVVNQNGEAVLTTPDIEDLSNVDVSSLTNGQILKYNSTTDKWENADESGGGGGSSTLAGLSDTNVNNPIHGQVLKYNMIIGKWINANDSTGSSSLSGLSDVDLSSPTGGQVLKYNSVRNCWENADESGGGGGGETNFYGANGFYIRKRQPIAPIIMQEKENWELFPDNGQDIWTDGINTYYSSSYSDTNYIYNSANDTWSEITWYERDRSHMYSFDGSIVWSDGFDIYTYYYDCAEVSSYILDKSTQIWAPIDFECDCEFLWSDGANIHSDISYEGNGYIFNRETKTFSQESWTIPSSTNIIGTHVWSDGCNIYYSDSASQYKLDRKNRTWLYTNWKDINGDSLNIESGKYIWTDGKFIYYTYQYNTYVLQSSTNVWIPIKFTGDVPTSMFGYNFWSDGYKIYYTDGNTYEITTNKDRLWTQTI